MIDNLPPLPHPAVGVGCDPGHGGRIFHLQAFSEQQMHEYARDAIAESEAQTMPAAWIEGKKAGLLEASKLVHRGVDTKDSGGLLASPWLPIDSAPKDRTTVILLDAEGGVQSAFFATQYGRWMGLAGWIRQRITHWMPIPPQPEVNQDEPRITNGVFDIAGLPEVKA